jgi:hypothetical protein
MHHNVIYNICDIISLGFLLKSLLVLLWPPVCISVARHGKNLHKQIEAAVSRWQELGYSGVVHLL